VALSRRKVSKTKSAKPTLNEENGLSTQGYKFIAGIDEVGRGSLAGPVVAAAVILPQPANFPWLKSVRDSKEISAAKRNILFTNINEQALAIGVGIIDHHVIDSVGILKATMIAMYQAIEQLAQPPDFLLIDALTLTRIHTPQKGIIKGDKLCISISCASIIAKVTRDQIMQELDQLHPGYGFAQHKGYGTKQHLACLQQLGPSSIHRHSFAPVREQCKLI
jgi:ribonuclease HII